MLIGEYEEAPENYGKPVYDSDEEDGKHVLSGLERLSAGGMRIPMPVPASRRSKRRYDEESSGEESESAYSYDSGVGSAGSVVSEWGRRVRRRVDEDAVSVCSYDDGSSDNEIDMEL